MGIRHLISVALITSLWCACACTRQECKERPPTTDKDSEATLSYYNFKALNPEAGFCESQVSGSMDPIREPLNGLFSLFALMLGLLGLFASRRVSTFFRILYALLAAYGVFAALYHVDIHNGFYRMMDVALSFLQAFTIIALFTVPILTIRRYPLSVGITLLMVLYPAVVHVLAESSPSPWVAWLVFDALWLFVLIPVVWIWIRRKRAVSAGAHPALFRWGWYALGSVFLAYVGWGIDKFLCSCETPWLAAMQLHGIWHILISVGFYYLIAMTSYLSAPDHGATGHIRYTPLGLPIVDWKP